MKNLFIGLVFSLLAFGTQAETYLKLVNVAENPYDVGYAVAFVLGDYEIKKQSNGSYSLSGGLKLYVNASAYTASKKPVANCTWNTYTITEAESNALSTANPGVGSDGLVRKALAVLLRESAEVGGLETNTVSCGKGIGEVGLQGAVGAST